MSTPTRRWLLAASASALVLACAGLEDAVKAVPIPESRKTFIGKWEGVGAELTITPDGGLAWEKTGGSGSASINAPIQKWGKGYFEAGVGPMRKRFTVNKPPHKKSGKWHMTVEGVALVRVL